VDRFPDRRVGNQTWPVEPLPPQNTLSLPAYPLISASLEGRMKKILVAAGILFALNVGASAAKPACRDAKGHFAKCPAMTAMPMHPVCRNGKPCGNSCIARDKVCHK
jgi:hypothetical protein